ncbi:MAG: DUF3052 domain-containing protein [Rubrivivax sp.]|nr:DUF3052 domain-containing protein [Rubrivivax sp.]
MADPAGYSGTPLAKKLGIVAGSRVALLQPPAGLPAWLAPLPEGVVFQTQVSAQTDLAQLFVTEQAVLVRELAVLRAQLRPDAALWVSWPKKSSRKPTDITEDRIREAALPLDFVDVKVCAVNEVWSGLKLVLRKALRGASR